MHLFWWIFWAIGLIAVLAWAWPSSRERRDLARETLRQRYAAGEITEEELRHRMAVLDERTLPVEQRRTTTTA
jgi:uncharacterized membrane protein